MQSSEMKGRRAEGISNHISWEKRKGHHSSDPKREQIFKKLNDIKQGSTTLENLHHQSVLIIKEHL